MSGNSREWAQLAAWVAGGTLVGVGLGLLFAPRAGTETRRAVARQAKRAQIEAIRVGRAVQSGVNETKKHLATKHERPVKQAA